MTPIDEISDEPKTEFSVEERQRLRKMLTAHERAIWFWATVGVCAKWFGYVAAAVAFMNTAFHQLKDVLK